MAPQVSFIRVLVENDENILITCKSFRSFFIPYSNIATWYLVNSRTRFLMIDFLELLESGVFKFFIIFFYFFNHL